MTTEPKPALSFERRIWNRLASVNSPARGDASAIAAEADFAIATERAAREAAVREVARLTACLLTANSNHEEFERRYYLEADRVEAAQMESVLLHSAINRACAGYPENSAAPTCVQILRAALAPQADPSVRPSVHPAESPVEGERRDGEASS